MSSNSITDILLSTACVLSNLVIRGGSYVFLRWIPGHIFPDNIAAAYAVYVASLLALHLKEPKYEVVARNSEVKLVEPDIPTREATAEVEVTGEDGVEGVPLLKPDPPIAIEAIETIVSRKKVPNALKSLALGTPEPNSFPLTLTNLLINTLLFLGVMDMTYTPSTFYQSKDLSFARVGYVSPNTAKILIREPDADMVPLNIQYRMEPEDGEAAQIEYPWITSQDIPKLGPATDYSLPLELHNLHPSTRYRYRTSNNHTGTFRTAPAPITALERAMGHNTRHTKFTFLASSCIKARFPYNPLKHPLHIRGFKILGDLLKKGLKADFMLFLGDFIYIDVPKRPKQTEKKSLVEGYREMYRQVYASPDWPAVGENLPWLNVIDDHEIANDWDSNTTGIYPYAMDPFYIYQHSINPPAPRPGATYYTFTHGTASFFLMDSRRFRSPNHLPDSPTKSMLGAQQLSDLLAWLRADDRENGIQWKILVSSVPFTKNWHFNFKDTWAGYLHERQTILNEMWKVGASGRGGVVILSGDRHEFAATSFPPPPGSNIPIHATVHEFSCSPFNQFYLPRRTYKQTDDEDVMIKYVPDGNSKFGAVEIDSTSVAGDQGVLKYRLFVDGVEVWDWVLTAETGRKGGVGERELKEGGRNQWE